MRGGELQVLSPGKKRLRGILAMCINTGQEGTKKREPDSSQQCPVTG